ncbi:hypothetical protein PhCBS80983_g03123 [Powellomyces hirtus]|uniref:Rho-GAP domain-containing protein n=1 Tax=Powellomyces hirtus TaxID=109895 RepID=A0A507E3N7_9FUNG|nr:hypothetical protein PhCBS80983_g03123 [Powellomyces hirtus]
MSQAHGPLLNNTSSSSSSADHHHQPPPLLPPAVPATPPPLPGKVAVDAGTQTDYEYDHLHHHHHHHQLHQLPVLATPPPSQPTVSINFPHSQLSFYHVDESANAATKGGSRKESKRMSAIIVSSKPSTPASETGNPIARDDMSVISISLPNRYSVSSLKSAVGGGVLTQNSPAQRRSGNGFIITDGEPDNVIAIDVLQTPQVYRETTADDSIPSKRMQGDQDSKSLDDFVPAPAYEEVVTVVNPVTDNDNRVPVTPLVEVASEALPPLTVVTNAAAPSSEEVEVEAEKTEDANDGLASNLMRKTLHSLPKLPTLSATEYIAHPETSNTIQSLAVGWPVLKSGLLFRKRVGAASGPASSASLQLRNIDRISTARMMGRSLGTLLMGKRRPRAHQHDAPDAKYSEEDDWNLFYAEVRGRYLMFYVLQEPLRPGASSVHSKQYRQSSTPRDFMLGKPIAKFFSSLGKKNNRSSNLRKPSVDFTGLQRDGRSSIEGLSRVSNDQQRNLILNMSPEAVRNAPRTLVHYLPLHKAMIEGVHSSKLGAMFAPGNVASYSSANSTNGNSLLILSTAPIDRPQHGNANMCDQLLLDVLLQEDFVMDGASELTVSTTQSAYRDSQNRQNEIAEWVAAIRAVTDIPGPATAGATSYSPSLINPTESRNASNRSDMVSVQTLFREEASVRSSNSIHSFDSQRVTIPRPAASASPLHDCISSSNEAQSSDTADSGASDHLTPSPPPKHSDSSSLGGRSHGSLPRSPLSAVSVKSELSVVPPANQQKDGKQQMFAATNPNSSSFAKKFSSRWKNTFELKDAPRAKLVISGPTNFTKVEISAEMLMNQHSSSDSGPVLGTSAQRPAVSRAKAEMPAVQPAVSAGAGDGANKQVLAEKVEPETRKTERSVNKRNLQKKHSTREDETEVAASAFRKEKEKKTRDGKDKKAQRANPLIISNPIPTTADFNSLHKQSMPSINVFPQPSSSQKQQQQQPPKSSPPPQQPSVSTSRLFFPFFHKSLFAAKGKEVPLPISPAAERLQRTDTMCSRTSTIRRRVGRVRPESGGTMHSDKGTIASGHRDEDDQIPLILKKCIALVEEIGMETEGLYRISGSATTVERLRRLLAMDAKRVHLQVAPITPISPLSPALSASVAAEVAAAASEKMPSLTRQTSRLSLTGTVSSTRSSGDFSTPKPPIEMRRASRTRRVSTSSILPAIAGFSGPSLYDNDVHVVTGVIKGFLRQGLGSKNVPICSFDLYEAFIAATQMADWRARMIAIQDMVHSLPPIHFATLKFVCEHLNRVAAESDKNRMSIRNLSIIFGPTLLKPPPALDSMARVIEDMPFQCTVVETLIEQAEWVFGPIEFEEVQEEVVQPLPAEDNLGGATEEQKENERELLSASSMDSSISAAADAGVVTASSGSDGAVDHNSGRGGGSEEEEETIPRETTALLSEFDSDLDYGSTVGVVDDNGEDNHSMMEPFSIARCDSIPTDDHHQQQQQEQQRNSPPRAEKSRNKMERRRGKVLPATYLSDYRPPLENEQFAADDGGGDRRGSDAYVSPPAASTFPAPDLYHLHNPVGAVGSIAAGGSSPPHAASPTTKSQTASPSKAAPVDFVAPPMTLPPTAISSTTSLPASASAPSSFPPSATSTSLPLPSPSPTSDRSRWPSTATVVLQQQQLQQSSPTSERSRRPSTTQVLHLQNSQSQSLPILDRSRRPTTTVMPLQQPLSSSPPRTTAASRRSTGNGSRKSYDNHTSGANNNSNTSSSNNKDLPPPDQPRPPRLSLNFDEAERSFLGHLLN